MPGPRHPRWPWPVSRPHHIDIDHYTPFSGVAYTMDGAIIEPLDQEDTAGVEASPNVEENDTTERLIDADSWCLNIPIIISKT